MNRLFPRFSVGRFPHLLLRRIVALCLVGSGQLLQAQVPGEHRLNGHGFTVMEGYEIEVAAPATICPRPITACFDEQARLYVADSSGSNAPVAQQLEAPTHRILRLEDSDGDGEFDRQVVFADEMMFPEGTLWYRGSLYVCAPPQIWKLTDTDGDGVADERDVWFDGKTLTGCANDLHGPYLGRDGWIYWCKGAFAEQTHELLNGDEMTTRASHIFRRHPEGGRLDVVMTGGMDNPVDVVFTPGGERLFTTTFLVHPRQGQRDGVIHAVYGGVWGKDHGVLEGHVRTGELMPVLAHLGPAAPAGLELIESAEDIKEPGELLACNFNLHRVTHHRLSREGTGLSATSDVFVSSDQVDFHPTDVIQESDDSWLVIDTGGWYKLCCPTSQLEKPDVLGAIYRVRKTGAASDPDPFGLGLDWDSASVAELVSRLGDPRRKVRERAMDVLGSRVEQRDEVVELLGAALNSAAPLKRLNAVWTLSRVGSEPALEGVRRALADEHATVVQAALEVIALHRDAGALQTIRSRWSDWSAPTRRIACAAIGRVGGEQDVVMLASGLEDASQLDRTLEHAVAYAWIELGEVAPLERLVADKKRSETVRMLAAVALSQRVSEPPGREFVLSCLAREDRIGGYARWLLSTHPEWADGVTSYVESWLDTWSGQASGPLPDWFSGLVSEREIARQVGDWLWAGLEGDLSERIALLSQSRFGAFHSVLAEGLVGRLSELPAKDRLALLWWMAADDAAVKGNESLTAELVSLVHESGDVTERLAAWAAVPEAVGEPNSSQVSEVLQRLVDAETPASQRLLLWRLLTSSTLDSEGLMLVVKTTESLPSTDWNRVFDVLPTETPEPVALAWLGFLQRRDGPTWLDTQRWTEWLEAQGEPVQQAAKEVTQALVDQRLAQTERLGELLAELPEGDIRRGQQLFQMQKTKCLQCHQMGYVGGSLGPDLSRIGQIRTRQDLLEAIAFPNASFVRSYEPVVIQTIDGASYSGILKEQNDHHVVLAVNEVETVTLSRDEIETEQAGGVSLMPSGFEQQLTAQELADLIAFLQAAR